MGAIMDALRRIGLEHKSVQNAATVFSRFKAEWLDTMKLNRSSSSGVFFFWRNRDKNTAIDTAIECYAGPGFWAANVRREGELVARYEMDIYARIPAELSVYIDLIVTDIKNK